MFTGLLPDGPVELTFFYDGVSPHKNSSRSFNPVLLAFRNLKVALVLPVYMLNGKTESPGYAQGLIDLLNDIAVNGIQNILPKGEILRVHEKSAAMDRVGYSEVKKIMSHNSLYGCPHCTIESIV